MDCSNFSNSSVSVRFRCEVVLARDMLDALLLMQNEVPQEMVVLFHKLRVGLPHFRGKTRRIYYNTNY